MKKKKLDEKMFYFFTSSSIKCKYCGHTIFPKHERELCTHCGYWNYRNKKIEFKYKTQESIIKEKRKK